MLTTRQTMVTSNKGPVNIHNPHTGRVAIRDVNNGSIPIPVIKNKTATQ